MSEKSRPVWPGLFVLFLFTIDWTKEKEQRKQKKRTTSGIDTQWAQLPAEPKLPVHKHPFTLEIMRSASPRRNFFVYDLLITVALGSHRLYYDDPAFLATLTRFGGGGTAKPAPRQIYAATTSMRTDMPR